jgi:hypothetical protein
VILGFYVATTTGCASVAVSREHQRSKGEDRRILSTHVGEASKVVAASNQPKSTGSNTVSASNQPQSTGSNTVSASNQPKSTGSNTVSAGEGVGTVSSIAGSERALGAVDVTANLDPSDDDVVGPPTVIDDCERRLEQAKVEYQLAKVPLIVQHKTVCGAHQAVQYLKGPEHIAFEPRPVVSCPLALGLARFEGLVQRLALKYFNQRVKRITQGGTYNCRSMARFKLVSEHSYANAIDLYGFTLANGKRITVLRDFGAPNAEPKGKEGAFLRELAQAAYDEGVFSVVATRFFDELHRDHIHVDMAHYRTDGTR